MNGTTKYTKITKKEENEQVFFAATSKILCVLRVFVVPFILPTLPCVSA